MRGTTRRDLTYYGCHGPRNTAGRPTMPNHPGAVYVREDVLLPAIQTVIAERVFGPHRREHLTNQHHTAPARAAQAHTQAITAAQAALDDITTRQDNITTELEETPPPTGHGAPASATGSTPSKPNASKPPPTSPTSPPPPPTTPHYSTPYPSCTSR